ncbi:MAG TPA: lipid-A-disaccharide synthase, partial [Nitrospiria bacterium]
REILSGTIDGVVLIDSPDFNMRMARVAKKNKIPTAYYIGPKFWAWRPGRVKKIARVVDRMLVIFPFEEPFYRRAGVPCDYVGNPLLDEMTPEINRDAARKRFGFSADVPVIGLLPGSRPMEIERLFGLLIEAFELVRAKLPDAVGIIPVAPSIRLSDLENRLGDRGDRIRLVEGKTADVLASADAALVASGTATLEAAIIGVPLVVFYKVGKLTEFIARILVTVKNVSLVNIIAGSRIVPEFIQDEATPINLAEALLDPLLNKEVMEKIKKELEGVRKALGEPGAAARAASGVLSLLPSGAGESAA